MTYTILRDIFDKYRVSDLRLLNVKTGVLSLIKLAAETALDNDKEIT